MSLSLSVLATIFFLAPGIAGFFGGMLGAAKSAPVQPSMPPANSLEALVAIVLVAVLAHGLTATALLLQHSYCLRHACLAIGVEPNVYGHIVDASRNANVGFGAADVLFALTALMGLCLATGIAAFALIFWDIRRGAKSWTASLFYGSLASYAGEASGGSALVIAYVLTKMRGEELAIGYRGILVEINLSSANKEVVSVTLLAAERFGVRLGPSPFGAEGTVPLAKLLPRVYLPGREIENIMLSTVPLDEQAGGGEPSGLRHR